MNAGVLVFSCGIKALLLGGKGLIQDRNFEAICPYFFLHSKASVNGLSIFLRQRDSVPIRSYDIFTRARQITKSNVVEELTRTSG